MHIPDLLIIDRIKTGTVIAGLKYYVPILFNILKMKMSNSKNSSNKLNDKSDKQSTIDNFHLFVNLLIESDH